MFILLLLLTAHVFSENENSSKCPNLIVFPTCAMGGILGLIIGLSFPYSDEVINEPERMGGPTLAFITVGSISGGVFGCLVYIEVQKKLTQ